MQIELTLFSLLTGPLTDERIAMMKLKLAQRIAEAEESAVAATKAEEERQQVTMQQVTMQQVTMQQVTMAEEMSKRQREWDAQQKAKKGPWFERVQEERRMARMERIAAAAKAAEAAQRGETTQVPIRDN